MGGENIRAKERTSEEERKMVQGVSKKLVLGNHSSNYEQISTIFVIFIKHFVFLIRNKKLGL